MIALNENSHTSSGNSENDSVSHVCPRDDDEKLYQGRSIRNRFLPERTQVPWLLVSFFMVC